MIKRIGVPCPEDKIIELRLRCPWQGVIVGFGQISIDVKANMQEEQRFLKITRISSEFHCFVHIPQSQITTIKLFHKVFEILVEFLFIFQELFFRIPYVSVLRPVDITLQLPKVPMPRIQNCRPLIFGLELPGPLGLMNMLEFVEVDMFTPLSFRETALVVGVPLIVELILLLEGKVPLEKLGLESTMANRWVDWGIRPL